MTKKIIRYLSLALFIAATVFIFTNSAQTADVSSGQSRPFVMFIKGIIAKIMGVEADDFAVTYFVRKAAHIVEFFIQSAFLATFFVFSSKRFFGVYVLFSGLLTSCVDEYIQTFSDGRAGMISDVFVDFCGVIIAFLCYAIVFIWLKKKKPDFFEGSIF